MNSSSLIQLGIGMVEVSELNYSVTSAEKCTTYFGDLFEGFTLTSQALGSLVAALEASAASEASTSHLERATLFLERCL